MMLDFDLDIDGSISHKSIIGKVVEQELMIMMEHYLLIDFNLSILTDSTERRLLNIYLDSKEIS